MTDAERQVLIAYIDQRNSIPDSDLDDDQPITLTVRTTIGECRKLQRRHTQVTEVVLS